MHLPKICTNKFFLLAIGASFAFTTSLYNIADNSIHDVKADFVTETSDLKEITKEINDKLTIIYGNQMVLCHKEGLNCK